MPPDLGKIEGQKERVVGSLTLKRTYRQVEGISVQYCHCGDRSDWKHHPGGEGGAPVRPGLHSRPIAAQIYDPHTNFQKFFYYKFKPGF